MSFEPCNAADLSQTSQDPPPRRNSSLTSQKRKRSEAAGQSIQEQPRPKRSQGSRASDIADEQAIQEAAKQLYNTSIDPVWYWIQTKRWPKEYFEQDSQVREDFERDSWLEKQMEESNKAVQYVEINGFRYPLPIRKVPTSLRRKQSDSDLTGSSDQQKKENKSAPYRNSRYATLLATKGSYLREFDDDNIPAKITDLCQALLKEDCTLPQESLFRNDIFRKTCRKLEDRNEARIIRDIACLIVPFAETLATYGAANLDHLIDSVNEGWIAGIPVEGPRPQPDYSVGFARSAFTAEQLQKISPFIGSLWDTSFFTATCRMFFPFLTGEVKCGAAALDIADRQNAHSMTLAVRGVVELFKLVKREKDLDREILAFSISHDHSSVRIYGHYALIEKDKTTFYRHRIREFSFTDLDGRDKWIAYKFSKSVYNTWMPTHLKRICSAIDAIPSGVNFEVSERASFPATQDSQQSNGDSSSFLGDNDSVVGSQDKTPRTSFTQGPGRQSKKPRSGHTAD